MLYTRLVILISLLISGHQAGGDKNIHINVLEVIVQDSSPGETTPGDLTTDR